MEVSSQSLMLSYRGGNSFQPAATGTCSRIHLDSPGSLKGSGQGPGLEVPEQRSPVNLMPPDQAIESEVSWQRKPALGCHPIGWLSLLLSDSRISVSALSH